ncbi:hypothetical protein Ptr902_01527 [Pyrenophora tritici-repentis]|nr:hypothetical protein PtrM4_014360 [Pyrenophora tritici-repentis]KAI1570988.1 hypothetical protein PtrEW4_005047 [Pyrenophora tritici-repentis]KAI1602895.1 hypothetical protein PtrCC142_004947 [Pyrenophora tritici-repentis]KAI2487394.1 hypothetical protein Ptr902_01527 [Pyrenophora tritici-repentis]PWO25423.1 hypothetical protein PtrARCrB10_06055 [Pyrenophora tritici-repentis]
MGTPSRGRGRGGSTFGLRPARAEDDAKGKAEDDARYRIEDADMDRFIQE